MSSLPIFSFPVPTETTVVNVTIALRVAKFNSQFFKKLFLKYILLFMLFQLPQYFPHCPPPPRPSPLPQATPTLLSTSTGRAYTSTFLAYCIPHAVLYIPMTIL